VAGATYMWLADIHTVSDNNAGRISKL